MKNKINQKVNQKIILFVIIISLFMYLPGMDIICQAATKVAKVTGITASVKTHTSAEVSWKAAKGANRYEVYRSTEKKGKYKKVATRKKGSKLVYKDSKLKTGQIYYYKVRAYYKSGKKSKYGAFSKVVKVQPVTEKTTISSIKSVNYKTVNIKWKTVPGANGYGIYMSHSKNGSYDLVKTVSGKKTISTNVTDIGPSILYYFKVRAYSNVNGEKVFGKFSSAKTGYSVPDTAKIVSVELNSLNSATLTWNFVSGSNGYCVYRSTSESSGYTKIGIVTDKSKKSFTDTLLVKNSTYYYKVTAYREAQGKKVEGNMSEPIKLCTSNSYIISTNSTPYAGNYVKNENYNNTTQNYFTLLSYMELFEKIGGGELVLKAGTYNLWKTVYIPSNTTIRFEDGVTIKTTTTSPSGNYGMFVLAEPSIMKGSTKYYGYNGVHDVKIIGKGTVVFDKNFKRNSSILIGHTRNVMIDGITFKNMNGSSHFIELDASKNVTIQNCTFTKYQDTGAVKEAINIDTPDRITGGFSGTYSSQDKTANDNILIQNNIFDGLPTAVGTHMYSDGHAHNGIKIKENTIRNCKYYGIRAMNWINSDIQNNTIDKITGNSGESLVIEMRGVSNMNVSGNKVSNSDRFMIIKIANYSQSTLASHPGLENYKPVYNSVEENDVIHNTLRNIINQIDIYYSNTLDFSDKQLWSVQ